MALPNVLTSEHVRPDTAVMLRTLRVADNVLPHVDRDVIAS